jgi:uncharacterized membrane protein HdeD (DUF308 family)
MSDMPFNETFLHGRLRSASHWFFWLGIIMVVLGIAAIVWPAISTIVATLFVGWMMLLSGMVVLFGSFSIQGTGPFFGAFLLAILSIAAAVFLLFSPQAGAIALTLVVAVVFLFQGAFEMLLAFEVRPFTGWVWMLMSAIVTVIVAMLIVAWWPAISLFFLGILLGVNFITTGIGYISIAQALKPSH